MSKIILFDGDGVTIKAHEFFSAVYARTFAIPREQIIPFFKHEYAACAEGKADLKEAIAPYLPQWNWTRTVEEFLDYWFSTENHLDQEVLQEIARLRGEGAKCYLVSDQEKYRAIYMLLQMDLGKYFDGTFFSCEVGAQKSEPAFFEKVMQKLDITPSEITFFDDDEENIACALRLGIDAIHYTGSIEVMRKINK